MRREQVLCRGFWRFRIICLSHTEACWARRAGWKLGFRVGGQDDCKCSRFWGLHSKHFIVIRAEGGWGVGVGRRHGDVFEEEYPVPQQLVS